MDVEWLHLPIRTPARSPSADGYTHQSVESSEGTVYGTEVVDCRRTGTKSQMIKVDIIEGRNNGNVTNESHSQRSSKQIITSDN